MSKKKNYQILIHTNYLDIFNFIKFVLITKIFFIELKNEILLDF